MADRKQSALYRLVCTIWQGTGNLRDKYLRKGSDFSYWMEQKEAGFSEEQGGRYQPSPAFMTMDAMKHLSITPDDSIIDVGCGKGAAMYYMAKFPFGKVGGVDLSQKLTEIANDNFRRLGLAKCHADCADATKYKGLDDFNYIYMFNPFPEQIMKGAMANLLESLERKPRKCTIVYAHPVCHSYIVRNTPFRLVDQKKRLIDWFDVYYYEYDPSLK
ncbi:MAG: class I SAM-dependent methyltransferase [Solobacterium sp.]|nr:class I SAM-dependent methyltransferase [Solobacterium sp.]